MKMQIVLNMQNPKMPGIAIHLDGWLARQVYRLFRVEVIIHKGGNNYVVPQLKKEENNAILGR